MVGNVLTKNKTWICAQRVLIKEGHFGFDFLKGNIAEFTRICDSLGNEMTAQPWKNCFCHLNSMVWFCSSLFYHKAERQEQNGPSPVYSACTWSPFPG